MITATILAILLTINILLLHFDKIITFYYYMYRKLIKPKFKIGELVMIDNVEFEIVSISHSSTPYVYVCYPVYNTNNKHISPYYHESLLKKKTGLLKELE